jgi:hypothetical protein
MRQSMVPFSFDSATGFAASTATADRAAAFVDSGKHA